MILRFFAVIYVTISAIFVWKIYSDPSASLGYAPMFMLFWLIAGITLITLVVKKEIQIKTNWDTIILLFATPIPLLVFLFFTWLIMAFL